MTNTSCLRVRAIARHVPLLCAAALAAVSVFANPAKAAVPEHIRRHDVAMVPSSMKPGRDGRLELSLRGQRRSFDLELIPSPSQSPHAELIFVDADGIHRSHPPASIYRGRLAGDPDASVSIAVSGASIVGSVSSGGESWYFEPLRRYDRSAAPGSTMIYSAGDLDHSELPPGACGAEEAGEHPATAAGPAHAAPSLDSASSMEPLSSSLAAAAAGSLGLLELSLVADYRFYADHGEDSAAYMQAIVDRVALLDEADLGITLSVVQTVVYRSPGIEPLTTSTSSGTLLGSLAQARLEHADVMGAGDVTQLFTGRDLDHNVIGIAYLSRVCDRIYASSVAQDFHSDLHLMTLLVGHELGHTMGAYHDGQSGSPCSGSGGGYVMWPSISSTLAERFSSCSIASIEPVLEAASCLSEAISADCGNGRIDAGEQCDDGGNDNGDCCRMDCRLDAAGSACGGDGNDCTTDICSSTGTCLHPVAVAANCDDGDACTSDGTCAAATCIASTEWTPMSSARLKARFAPGDQLDALQLRALVAAGMQSPPTEGGATLRFLDEAGGLLRESFVEAARWSAASSRSFRFDAGEAEPADAVGLRSMLVRFRPGSSSAKVKLKAAAADLTFLEGRSQVGVQVLIGDSASGDCGTAPALSCRVGNGSLSCG